MEQVILFIATLAVIALALSIWQTSQLAILAVHRPGIGRILFLAQASLKLWAALALFYGIANSIFDWEDGGLHTLARVFLGVYLVVQPIAVNIAVWRWKKLQQPDNKEVL